MPLRLTLTIAVEQRPHYVEVYTDEVRCPSKADLIVYLRDLAEAIAAGDEPLGGTRRPQP